eukprot:scaffold11040_cov142-Skeletonema_dohrnii-CCMP3373.AAC.2
MQQAEGKKVSGIVQYTSRTLTYNHSCGALTTMEIRMQWEVPIASADTKGTTPAGPQCFPTREKSEKESISEFTYDWRHQTSDHLLATETRVANLIRVLDSYFKHDLCGELDQYYLDLEAILGSATDHHPVQTLLGRLTVSMSEQLKRTALAHAQL